MKVAVRRKEEQTNERTADTNERSVDRASKSMVSMVVLWLLVGPQKIMEKQWKSKEVEKWKRGKERFLVKCMLYPTN